MKVDLDLINEKSLNPWPNRYDPKRYYVDFWKRKFQPDIDRYNEKYHVYRFQDEIKVYFDTDGYLHIYCKDKKLAIQIYRYFENWYDFICRKQYVENKVSHQIGLMIEPFHSNLTNGFVQIRYKGMVCNLSPEQLKRVALECAESGYFKGTCIIEVDTGIPRLDTIVTAMLED